MSDTEHQYPSLLRRFATINYDLLLLVPVCMLYVLTYIAIAKLIFEMPSDRPSGTLFQLGWLLTIISFFCYFWMKGGQTTGMRAWRMKIGTLDGEPPQLMQCIARFLLAPLGWLCFFTSFFDAKKQCLHDKLSKTQLILLPKEKKK